MLGIRDLSSEFKKLNSTGQSLTLEERMNLELSLTKIYEIEDFEEVLFWGKISGVTRDYFIAMAINYKGHYEFPWKRYFWCNNVTWEFAELPNINANDRDPAEGINTNFSGNHVDVLFAPAGEEEADPVDPPMDMENDDKDSLASTEEEKIPPKNFTELDRLSYVVRAIDHETSVVPKGSFKLTQAHELARNKQFGGLPRSTATDLSNFQHFRNIQFPDMRDALDADDAILSTGILDAVERDTPAGCWSAQMNSSQSGVIVKSLLWPGYFSYCDLNGQSFGGVYMGDGIKNSDLPFLL